MAEQMSKPSPMNHAMLVGLELGVWFAANMIISALQLKYTWMSIISWLVMFAIISLVYRATMHYKLTECDGKLTFGQAYKYIMCLFACASLVAAVLRFAYLQWFNSAYLTTLYEMAQPMLKQLNGGDLPDEMLQSLQAMLTPIRFSVYYILYDMVAGVFLGLLVAPFVSRRNFPKPPQNEQ